MIVNQLTTKELAFIEDQIRAEEIIAKTMNWCASQCEDQELRTSLEQLAESHQLKIADLAQYFNRSKFIQ
jgi:ferritin-like metal-binding protein YciE